MIRKSLIGLFVLSAVAMTSGCGNFYETDPCGLGAPRAPSNEVNAVAVVFQASEDFPDAKSAISQDSRLRGFFPRTFADQPFAYALIAADGAPNVIFQSWVQKADGDGQQDLDFKSDRALSGLGNIYECAFSSRNFNSGFEDNVSLFPALDLAAKVTSKASGERKIFVYSNGLQTAGQPNFSEFIPSSPEEIDSIIDRLAEANSLPDLSGVEVYWTGIGQVTKSGDPLSFQTVNLLEIFWKKVIIASGGSVPEGFDTGAFGNTAPENASESLTAAKLQEICFSATLDESQGFEFQPDTAKFVNDFLARAGAKSIAQGIIEKQCSGSRILVTGYTASGTSKGDFKPNNSVDQALSAARAQAFSNLLVDEGILVSEVVGGGKGNFVDWNEDGSFNSELGKRNRVVKIEEIR